MPVTRNQSSCAERSQAAASAVAAAEGTSKPKVSSVSGEASTETEPPRPDSPENCSICLGPFSNKSFTSSCAHSFCFTCLKQWSKVKAECPLCKQSFTSIFHTIRSNDSYDIYELPPMNPPHQLNFDNFIDFLGGNLTTYEPNRPNMSLPQPQWDASLTLSNFSRFQFRNRRYDRYLNPVPPVPSEHQYSYSNATFNPSSHVSAASWPTGTEAFRLHVYRYHLGPPAVVLGCETSTYRLTPAMVNASAHRVQRIMPWLTRELRVLLRSHQSVRLAISIIQPLLSQVTVDSAYFRGRVSPLIGRRGEQFIQEFIAFTNSALTMQAFDRKAMYRRHLNRFYVDNTSSSSSDDDAVVEVTEVSPDVQVSNVTSSSSNTVANLQRARWDSPTPGPSWEIMDTHISVSRIENDQVSVSSESDPVFQPLLNDSDADNSEAGSDIVFLKFDKPWNQRSPVRVSSDSEGGGHSRRRKKLKHKNKVSETLDTSVETAEKEKRHRSSKSRSKERIRPSISNSENELQLGEEVNVSVPQSSEKRKRKRHRRTREKGDNAERHEKSDRELVDRIFAEAVMKQHISTFIESGDANIPSSSKSRDKATDKSSSKEKHKRKRKKRSRSSASPSVFSSYKKHHSGHKKSSDKHEPEKRKNNESENRNKHESEKRSKHDSEKRSKHGSEKRSKHDSEKRSKHGSEKRSKHGSEKRSKHDSDKRKHKRRRKSKENAASDYSSRRTASLEKDSTIPRNQPSASAGHSVTGTFQASYLPGTDNVQHIPLNLWVTAWPSVHVSHSFPAPSASVSFPPPSQPPPASSSFSSQHLNYCGGEHTNSAINSQTISSDSQSSSDSDTGHRSCKNFHRASDCSRTRQWLDANFSGVRQNPAWSSSLRTTSETSNSARNCSVQKASQSNTNTADVNTNTFAGSGDVVSIESGDEDIFVSSASSTGSDSEEITAIENSNDTQRIFPISGNSNSCTGSDVLKNVVTSLTDNHCMPSVEKEKKLKVYSSSSKNTSSPSCSSFQPFKLHKKSTPTKQNVNPIFSTATQNSDDDVEVGDSKLHTVDHEKSCNTLRNSSVDSDFKTNLNRLVRSQRSAHLLNSNLQAVVSSEVTVPVLERDQLRCLNPGEQNVTVASTGPSTISAAESVFRMLPPPSTALTTAGTPSLTSSLSYIHYSSVSVSAAPSSVLSQSSFAIPLAPLPATLPLHFPNPSVLPASSTVLPAADADSSQDTQGPPATSVTTLRKGTNPSCQILLAGDKFAVDVENYLSCKVARKVAESETSA